jgi:GAF domain-containing protein
MALADPHESLPAPAAARLDRLARRALRMPVALLPVDAGARAFAVSDARTHPLLREEPVVEELGIVACAGVPLHAGLEPVGAFCAYLPRPHSWTDPELEAIADLAAIAQSEIGLRAATRAARTDREDAERAQAGAESAGDVLARLTAITDAARGVAGQGALVGALAGAAARAFGVPSAVIDLLDEQGVLHRRAAVGPAAAVAPGPLAAGEGFAGAVLTSGGVHSVADLPSGGNDVAALATAGLRAALGAPLAVGGRPIGVIVVADTEPREWTPVDAELLEQAADRLAIAITQEQANENQRTIADTLQHALLPTRLPSSTGLRLAGRYRPAENRIGGDWYDVFALADGRVGIAVGDVVGHGIAAAAAAVRLRHFVRGYVLRGHAPGEVVCALNRLVVHERDAAFSSMVYAEIDPRSGRMRWASAGHMPPVLLRDGGVQVLAPAGGSLLGAMPLDPWPEREDRLVAGDRVVLYTDGLVEQPGETLDEGIEAIFGSVGAQVSDPDELADALLAVRPDPGRDDAAVLIAALP